MSDTTEETMQREGCASITSSDISDDIIDVSGIDFSDHDTWLQPPSLEIAENRIGDLDMWLKTNVEETPGSLQDSRKFIDTRTFTRPKKRSGRLSFESIQERRLHSPTNVWNRGSPNVTQEEEENVEATKNDRDSIPHMLRPSLLGVSSLSNNSGLTSGQESLEAFLNMSKSKGIDSFIDLAEPEFSDDIMDVSQPSVLYSSVLSVATEDLSQTMNNTLSLNQSQTSRSSGIEDSQILTESMMQTSMFGDEVDVNFNDTFGKNSANVTVLENIDYCSMDATFVATTELEARDTANGTFNTGTFSRGKAPAMDTTYSPSQFDTTITDPYASYIVDRASCTTPDVKLPTINDASYIVTPEIISKESYIVRSDVAKDASFIITSAPPDNAGNSTYRRNSPNREEQNNTFSVQNWNTTFEKTPISSPKNSSIHRTIEGASKTNSSKKESFDKSEGKIESKVEHDQLASHNILLENIDKTIDKVASKGHLKLNVPHPLSKLFDAPNTDELNNTFNIQNLDATFDKSKMPSKKSTAETLNETQTLKVSSPCSSIDDKPANKYSKTRGNFETAEKESSSANREVPGEPQDATFWKPASKPMSKLALPRQMSKILDTSGSTQQNETFNVQDLDATFEKPSAPSPRKTVSSSTMKLSSNEHAMNETFSPSKCRGMSLKTDQQRMDTSRGGSLDNLDTTFNKPASKDYSQMPPPRALSRLPQSFQKSNPNLGSSTLKFGGSARSGIPSFGFNRGIPRPSTGKSSEFTSKLLVLGKMKSGSEQRLDMTRNVSELQIARSSGSTESIDSTQSAHSAPDLDDRLSVRSDGSNTAYSIRTMNIEEFQKIVHLQDDRIITESTPKHPRRVMENNWVVAKTDLPSPILKNGPETYGSRGSSPRSTDSTVKTSSPLLSPTESLQNLPMDPIESNKDRTEANKQTINRNKNIVEKKVTQDPVKPLRNSTEPRTGLRPPASWTSANRPSSGIPRPASRIPGPRFIRPNTKVNQGDTKK